MKAKIKKAAVLRTTAIRNKLHKKAYLKADSKSILKMKIGRLLLFRKPNWREFEITLRKYTEQRLNEVKQ